MAIEIVDQKYRFMQPQKSSKYDSSNGIYYNYLHDLESILWILIWTLLSYREHTIRANSEPKSITVPRAGTYSNLFKHNEVIQGERERMMEESDNLEGRAKWISKYFQPLKTLAASFRNSLHKAYIREEKGFALKQVIIPSKSPVHQTILRAFKKPDIKRFRKDGLCVTRIGYSELICDED